MPVTFDILSRLMVVLAIAIVVFPLIRGGAVGRVWPSVAVAAVFVYLGSAIVYPKLSNWHWPSDGEIATSAPESGAPTPQQIAQLQAAADAAPENAEAWATLASALLSMRQSAAAVAPLEKVFELTGGANVEWTLLLIDALMMTDDGARERVSGMVEGLLTTAPDHPKALYYGAELAFSRNDLGLARTRWQRLLTRAEQDDSAEAVNVREVLQKRIALVSERLGDAPDGASTGPASAVSGPALRVSVTLSAEQRDAVSADDAVFILARSGAGPPVAVVRRRVADLPLQLTLTDADAMLPSRRLSNFEQVEVVARVALGGSPTAQSGDIFGSIDVETTRTEPVVIQMGQIAP